MSRAGRNKYDNRNPNRKKYNCSICGIPTDAPNGLCLRHQPLPPPPEK